LYGRGSVAHRLRIRAADNEEDQHELERMLPLEQAMKFELVLNKRTANVLGLTIPEPVLDSGRRRHLE
jgi:hypothetical protein